VDFIDQQRAKMRTMFADHYGGKTPQKYDKAVDSSVCFDSTSTFNLQWRDSCAGGLALIWWKGRGCMSASRFQFRYG
jgi:hypothetical protein